MHPVRAQRSEMDAVSDLEMFLDDNEDYLGPALRKELIGIYQSIDDAVEKQEDVIEDLQEQIGGNAS